MQGEANILSEDAYSMLTGQEIDVKPGTYMNLTNEEETSLNTNETAKEFTNMVTREQLFTEFAGYAHYDLLTGEVGCSVLDNDDYTRISEGLTDEWRGRMVRFNVDGEDSYSSRVQKIRENEAGQVYWGDTDKMEKVSYEQSDSFAFRQFWRYQPNFRILDQNDYLRNMAVMVMMFLFRRLRSTTAIFLRI